MKLVFDAIASVIRSKKKPALKKGEIVDIYGRPVKDALEYFYPKQITGIPVFSVDSIYDHYKDLVKEVKKNSGIGEHRNENGVAKLDYLFTEVIKRYIEYVHMLPASENHHHSTPGGMIVHSLEASAHAQKFAKENKPESLGMQDLDRQSLPMYRYAAWLATFMHDAGKVLRDIVVDAVDVEDGGKNVRVSNRSPIPSWQPQKESLIGWAKRFNVATYSVTYIKDRVHNQHNVDSVQLLQPVLGKGLALEFLLSSPADVHGRLVRVLAGHDNGRDYIASSVRRGDMLSTSRNVAQLAGSTFLTEQSMSAQAKIYKAMKIAKQDWSYNTLNADVWVIGGEVYLRYAKAFHSIIKTANKNDLTIPNDLSVVTMIMEESGITEAFDTQHKSVKFVQGQYTDKQLEGMLTGKEIVTWMELVKVKWKGLLFGDEPMPDSEQGVFYFPEKNELVEVTNLGEFKPFIKKEEQNEVQTQTKKNGDKPKTDEGKPSNKSEKVNSGDGDAPPVYDEQNPPPPTEEDTPPVNNAPEPARPSTKPNVKKVIEEAKKGSSTKKPTLNFKNQKSKKAPSESDKEHSASAQKSESDAPKQTNKPVSNTQNTAAKKSAQTKDKSNDAVSKPSSQQSKVESVGDTNKSEGNSLGEISKHVKLHTSKVKPGVFVAIGDVLEYLKMDDKAKVTKMMVEAGVARLEDNAPVVILEPVDGKRQQMICINVVAQTTKKDAPSNANKQTTPRKLRKPKQTQTTGDNSKQGAAQTSDTENNKPVEDKNAGDSEPESKAEETVKSDAEKIQEDKRDETKNTLDTMIESVGDDVEEVADYGLAMRVKDARKGSLAYYVDKVLAEYEANADKRDFVIEKDGLIALNATRLIEQVKKEKPESKYQLRHVIKSCKASNVEVERKQIGGVNYIQIPSQSIQDIDVEV
jgi:hypothetical protein